MMRERPVLVYDGDCGFCRSCVERLRAVTGERVEYLASRDAAVRFPEITAEEFDEAVQFVGESGARGSGAEAVFRALATTTRTGRWLQGLHSKIPFFARLSEGLYRLVARNRGTLSRVTRLLSRAAGAKGSAGQRQ